MKTHRTLQTLLIATIILVVGLNMYLIQININKKTEAATSVTHNINP